MRVFTKHFAICAGLFIALLTVVSDTRSLAQVPRAMSYQGIIQKDGSPLNGDGVFMFTLYHGSQVVWRSLPMESHVTGGLFSTILGPFADTIQLNGVDSLGISFEGVELSPRVALTSVAYSLYARHAMYADSAATPGPRGPKGDKGEDGIAGVKGDKGDPGIAGPKGDGGIQGTKGDKGELGLQGLKGDKGDKGELGLSGIKGDKGDKGELGLQGMKGDKGDKGELGLPGTKGDKGDKGELGLQGMKGDKGDKGELGLPGIKGEKGDKGDFGLQGLKGDKGDKGDLGSPGMKGDKGDLGLQGVRGDKGDPGSPGARGDMGLQGLKGDRGDKGDMGSSGMKGDKGDKGDRGDSGAFASTNNADGTIVYSAGDIRLVRTGGANGFRLESSSDPSLTSAYSATWFSGNDGPSQVEAHRGTVRFGSNATFNVGAAHRVSIMFKVNNVWAKIDLFRANTTDNEWYGFSVSN